MDGGGQSLVDRELGQEGRRGRSLKYRTKNGMFNLSHQERSVSVFGRLAGSNF